MKVPDSYKFSLNNTLFLLLPLWSRKSEQHSFPNFLFLLRLCNSTYLPKTSPYSMTSGAKSSIAEHGHIHTGLRIVHFPVPFPPHVPHQRHMKLMKQRALLNMRSALCSRKKDMVDTERCLQESRLSQYPVQRRNFPKVFYRTVSPFLWIRQAALWN